MTKISFSLLAAVALQMALSSPARADFSFSFYNFESASVQTTTAMSRINSRTADVAGTVGTINYANGASTGTIGGDLPFPANVNLTNFGLLAEGKVTGLSAPTSFFLGVNSDDGFFLEKNGTFVNQFPNGRTQGDSITNSPVSLQNGDVLTLYYFQDDNAAEVEFFVSADSQGNGARALVGDPTNGFTITPVPEPSSVIGMLVGGLGLAACVRRRISRGA